MKCFVLGHISSSAASVYSHTSALYSGKSKRTPSSRAVCHCIRVKQNLRALKINSFECLAIIYLCANENESLKLFYFDGKFSYGCSVDRDGRRSSDVWGGRGSKEKKTLKINSVEQVWLLQQHRKFITSYKMYTLNTANGVMCDASKWLKHVHIAHRLQPEQKQKLPCHRWCASK